MYLIKEAHKKILDVLLPPKKTEWPVVLLNDEQYADSSSYINAKIKYFHSSVDMEDWEMLRRMLKIQDINWTRETLDHLIEFPSELNVKTYRYRPKDEWPFSIQSDDKAISFVTAHPPNTKTVPAYSYISNGHDGAYFMYLPIAAADIEIAQLARSFHRTAFNARDDDHTWVKPQLGINGKSISLFKAMLSTREGLSQTTFYHTYAFDFLLNDLYFRTFASNGQQELIRKSYTTWPDESSEI